MNPRSWNCRSIVVLPIPLGRLRIESRNFSEHVSGQNMNHRINSGLHVLSACYWALATVLGSLVVPHPSYRPLEVRLWIGAGLALIALDLVAGVKQWRSAAGGKVLSRVLHFVVTVMVTSLITFEYLQAEPRSLLNWFRRNNYWFIIALVSVRLCTGAALLLRDNEL
jgi:hypothetical protein